jgi:diguanylate cyclase (GGDEF)-like protein
VLPLPVGASRIGGLGGAAARALGALGALGPLLDSSRGGAGIATPSARRPGRSGGAATPAQTSNPGRNVVERVVKRVPEWLWAALGALAALSGLLAFVALAATTRSRKQGLEVAQLQNLAATDSLTGLLNRGALVMGLESEISRAERHGRQLSLVFFDVAGLKAINDLHGHAAGDRLLQAAAGLLLATSRDHDLVGRIGGDECVVVLPEQDRRGAVAFRDRVLERMPATRDALGLSVVWDLSAGISSFPDDGETGPQLLESADRRLYEDRGIQIEPPKRSAG